MLLRSLFIKAAAPIRRLRSQSPLIERHLKLRLDEREARSIQTASDRIGVPFGAYYYWQLQKTVVNNHIRRLKKRSILSMVAALDTTDYAPLDQLRDDPRGLLVALPHHGHFILSIVAVVERLRDAREVYIFFGSPKTHAGNEIFDDLHAHLFGHLPGVHVIHDNRSGLARALRALPQGAAVIIMPDVYRNEHDTFVVPFCGRQLSVPLGTASIARKTNSVILPLVSLPTERAPGFRNVFGDAIAPTIESPDAEAGSLDDDDTVHRDYGVTLRMFRHFEQVMDRSILHWQYVRGHYLREAPFPSLTAQALKDLIDPFFADPRTNVNLGNPLRLD